MAGPNEASAAPTAYWLVAVSMLMLAVSRLIGFRSDNPWDWFLVVVGAALGAVSILMLIRLSRRSKA